MYLPLRTTLHSAYLLWLSGVTITTAQIVQNGQVFTHGLAIVDAPQPNTAFHAGDYLTLAVDVSGNGKLPPITSSPYSNLPNSFWALEFYLISADTGVNFTISVGNTMLYQEGASTVKHLSCIIPKCMAAGSYNLTAYETSIIRGIPRFSITPIPVQIQDSAPAGSCVFLSNPLQPQPQPANQEQRSPWLDPDFVPAPTFSMPGIVTVTIGPSGVVWPVTTVPIGMSTTMYIQPSVPASMSPSVVAADITSSWGTSSYVTIPGGVGESGSVGMQIIHTSITVTPTPPQVTVVFVSLETLTQTATLPGETIVMTTTATSTVSFATAFVGSASDGSQFLPVNSAIPVRITLQWYYMLIPLLAFTVRLWL